MRLVILKVWEGLCRTIESSARAQAAHRLASMGYHEEAKHLMKTGKYPAIK